MLVNIYCGCQKGQLKEFIFAIHSDLYTPQVLMNNGGSCIPTVSDKNPTSPYLLQQSSSEKENLLYFCCSFFDIKNVNIHIKSTNISVDSNYLPFTNIGKFDQEPTNCIL